MTFTPSYAQIDSPDPINAQDLATKHYIDLRTPSLPAPVTSGSGVQSFTDALGDVWVAANGVNAGAWKRARDVLHAFAYRSAAINSPIASTIFLHDTVGGFVGSQDAYSLYNSATGAFTPPIAGWWQIYHQVGVTATAAGQWLQAVLRNTGQAAAAGAVAQSGGTSGAIAAGTSYRGALPAGYQLVTYVQSSVALAVIASAYWTFLHIDYLGTG